MQHTVIVSSFIFQSGRSSGVFIKMFLHAYSWRDLDLIPVGPSSVSKEIRQLYTQQKLQGMKTYGTFLQAAW